MFSVKARETMRLAEQGNPVTPQFTIYKNKTYTVAETGDTTPGTMPAWAAETADRLDILTLIEKSNDKREKSNKSKHRRS